MQLVDNLIENTLPKVEYNLLKEKEKVANLQTSNRLGLRAINLKEALQCDIITGYYSSDAANKSIIDPSEIGLNGNTYEEFSFFQQTFNFSKYLDIPKDMDSYTEAKMYFSIYFSTMIARLQGDLRYKGLTDVQPFTCEIYLKLRNLENKSEAEKLGGRYISRTSKTILEKKIGSVSWVRKFSDLGNGQGYFTFNVDEDFIIDLKDNVPEREVRVGLSMAGAYFDSNNGSKLTKSDAQNLLDGTFKDVVVDVVMIVPAEMPYNDTKKYIESLPKHAGVFVEPVTMDAVNRTLSGITASVKITTVLKTFLQ